MKHPDDRLRGCRPTRYCRSAKPGRPLLAGATLSAWRPPAPGMMNRGPSTALPSGETKRTWMITYSQPTSGELPVGPDAIPICGRHNRTPVSDLTKPAVRTKVVRSQDEAILWLPDRLECCRAGAVNLPTGVSASGTAPQHGFELRSTAAFSYSGVFGLSVPSAKSSLRTLAV